jgi:Na+-translocating ferredoxin:NAD+ oxidoreductase RnfG subunit
MRIAWLVPLGVAAAPLAQVAYAAQYMTAEQAQRAAFPDATEFHATALTAEALAGIAAAPGWSPKVWRASAGERGLGWLLVDQVIGKSELITYAVALDGHGAVMSVEILDYRESHGGEIRLAGWRRQFVGKSAADPVELNKDIRNISGATLSCRHVTEGVRRLLQLYRAALQPQERS